MKNINTIISKDRNLDEIKCVFSNINMLRNSELLYDHYSTHVLSIDAFKMTDAEYRQALLGL